MHARTYRVRPRRRLAAITVFQVDLFPAVRPGHIRPLLSPFLSRFLFSCGPTQTSTPAAATVSGLAFPCGTVTDSSYADTGEVGSGVTDTDFSGCTLRPCPAGSSASLRMVSRPAWQVAGHDRSENKPLPGWSRPSLVIGPVAQSSELKHSLNEFQLSFVCLSHPRPRPQIVAPERARDPRARNLSDQLQDGRAAGPPEP